MVHAHCRLHAVTLSLSWILVSVISEDLRLQQSNLLLIMFDDLRPELSIYGRNHMITPNFERLAARSVVFDNAHAQISVCNPSRDSLLTGLRPDTVGTYGFQSSFRPHLTIPSRLASAGYETASYGKIAHWETEDRHIWTLDHWNGGWYDYQQFEWSIMNSSTMPDKVKPEEEFRDYIFASRTIETLKKLNSGNKYFMLSVGFKLPHIAVHVPYKYYDMYKGKEKSWELSEKELRFPPSAPAISYRCCADKNFHFMKEEGAKKSKEQESIGNINEGITGKAHNEMMMGYAAAVTFVDKQLGRILDAVDELELWSNLTIVLTADHGMHNGEKGMWEKWTLYDESTRVPLIIAHPLSPFKGQHHTAPVELIDIFPTLNDILLPPKYEYGKYCKPPGKVDLPNAVCNTLQGKSLVRAVLGDLWDKSIMGKKMIARQKIARKSKKKSIFSVGSWSRNLLDGNGTHISKGDYGKWKGLAAIDRGSFATGDGIVHTNSVIFDRKFSISQCWRCSPKTSAMQHRNVISNMNGSSISHYDRLDRATKWNACDKLSRDPNTLTIMGYSIRTQDYRYIAWFNYDRDRALPLTNMPLFEEELYDHRNESLLDFTHRELDNVAYQATFATALFTLKSQLIHFIEGDVVFRGPFK